MCPLIFLLLSHQLLNQIPSFIRVIFLLDFAIAIRTAICKDDQFVVTAGAGIVEGSDPASEAEETRNKARGVLCAIETAGRAGD